MGRRSSPHRESTKPEVMKMRSTVWLPDRADGTPQGRAPQRRPLPHFPQSQTSGGQGLSQTARGKGSSGMTTRSDLSSSARAPFLRFDAHPGEGLLEGGGIHEFRESIGRVVFARHLVHT